MDTDSIGGVQVTRLHAKAILASSDCQLSGALEEPRVTAAHTPHRRSFSAYYISWLASNLTTCIAIFCFNSSPPASWPAAPTENSAPTVSKLAQNWIHERSWLHLSIRIRSIPSAIGVCCRCSSPMPYIQLVYL
jgi:hypothetical protein